ncbi:MAG: putative oxygen-independent coproporphyrinogen III oxidase [Colwellia sp.]|jgi:putative oxygen-independent coproporphyrinogen III oxidase
MLELLENQPLSLYIHIPWCVEKCPYCDFNSHAVKSAIPEQDYIAALIADLDEDIERFGLTNRALCSIFIGGGTPSLFSAISIQSLLKQVLSRFDHKVDIEITLEANPGTVEADKFIGFFNAGVNRLSIGVQSFSSDKLIKLGRIHDSDQAKIAAKLATESGVTSFNLDLMHGLPNQSLNNALDDLKTAISLNPNHISWYQLTIEPNTIFHSKPPKLPIDDILWEIQDQGVKLLNEAGYQQYEISAYAKPGYQCQHNLNYWQYGDYLGIGCGAHGKITNSRTQKIIRTIKVKHPKGYLDNSRNFLDQLSEVDESDRPFEFMMNQLRLHSAFNINQFQASTGLNISSVLPLLKKAQQRKLMVCEVKDNEEYWLVTQTGQRYLNDLLEIFL